MEPSDGPFLKMDGMYICLQGDGIAEWEFGSLGDGNFTYLVSYFRRRKSGGRLMV